MSGDAAMILPAWIAAGLAVLAFAAAFLGTGIIGVSRSALRLSSEGIAALTGEMDDDAKEAAVRRVALHLLGASFGILWRLAVCVLAAAVPLWAADATGLAAFDAACAVMLDPVFLIGSTLVLVTGVWAVHRLIGGRAEAGGYSEAERIFHMAAFARPVQGMLMRLDERLFALSGRAGADLPPVFVTSIARGGTTAVLKALHGLPAVATHTYRDMPFITATWTWSRISRLAGRRTDRRERAHGDGMEIDLDSPEAFDEVLWKYHWPAKYRGPVIETWTPQDADPRRSRSLARAFDRIVAQRRGARVYVSKNNANLARLDVLPRMFPGCRIVVPLRRPGPHAASLLRQHRNFVAQQGADPFVKRYMADIGHHEFGLALKPLGLPGFDPAAHDPMTPDYWLAYWIAAFAHVAAHRGSVEFVTQEDLRAAPEATMRGLLDRCGIPAEGAPDFATFFRPGPDETDESVFSPALLARAEAIHAQLAERRRQAA